MTPGSSPHYPIASSASNPVFTGMPPSYPIQQRQQAAKPAPKRSRALIIVVPAIVVGVTIGIALGLGGGKNSETVAEAEVDNAPMPPAGTTTMGAAPEPGSAAAQPAAPSQETNAGSAQPTAPSGDSNAATNQPTVPTVPEAKPAPAEPITVPEDKIKSVDMTKPDKPPRKVEDKPERRPEPKPDVAALFKAGNYGDVVSACNASGKVLALNATVCTLAACKKKETAKAKRWFSQVGAAKKASVQKDCDGVIPAEKSQSKDDPCKTDPMACQH